MFGRNHEDALKIRVSDLAAYADCPRCVQRFWRDGEALNAADHRGKRSRTRQRANADFRDARSEEICALLPAGRFGPCAKRLATVPFSVLGHPLPVIIKGELPVPLELDGGGYVIVRPTTAQPSPRSRLYIRRQLEAYALLAERSTNSALRHPRELWISWCKSLGESVVPVGCERVQRDRVWFGDELERITALVRSRDSASPSPTCTRCKA